ncbi:MAG: hypothetical protein IPL07_22290 [Acidimicrobiaceae bacterium]|nr:hypothetical protein [Acidimicrobiaceae bacterium]
MYVDSTYDALPASWFTLVILGTETTPRSTASIRTSTVVQLLGGRDTIGHRYRTELLGIPVISQLFGDTAINVAMNVQVAGSTVPGNFATLVYEPYSRAGATPASFPTPGSSGTHFRPRPAMANGGRRRSDRAGEPGDPQPWSFFVDLYTVGRVVRYFRYNLSSSSPDTITAAGGVTFDSTTTDF